MGSFKDLKVAYKLAAIGVLAFIATVCVGLLGYFSLQQAKEDVEEMYNQYTMSIYYCAKVRYNTRYAQVQASLQPYTVKEDRRKSRVDKFNQAMNEAEENMQLYEKLNANNPQRAAMAAEVRKDFDQYKTNSARLLNMNSFDGGDPRAPMNYYEENVMPLAVKMSSDLGEVQQLNLDKAKEGLANSEAEMNAAIRNMVITCVAIIVILTVAIFYVTKQITDPLQLVVAVCTKLSHGDFRTGGKIGTDGRKDEFGIMETAVKEMRITVNDLIKKVMHSTEQLASSSHCQQCHSDCS